jgi:hypothetical protein
MLTLKQKSCEWMLVATLAALLAVALLGPAITQPVHQHAFADQRLWASVPHAMDVLSNGAFALFGMWGLVKLMALMRRVEPNAQHALAALFFTGLIVTAAASTWYHLQPDDAGLGVDRLGMVVAFAGLLGLAVAGRAGHAAGAITAGVVLLLAPLSIWLWLASANVLPWLVVQFGGMLIILILAFVKPLPRTGGLAVRWGVVVAIYAIAKLFEMADHDVYSLTHEVVSGHSLKHLIASLAAWPVIAALPSASASAHVPAGVLAENTGRIRVAISNIKAS